MVPYNELRTWEYARNASVSLIFSIDVNNQLDDEYNHTKTRKYFGPVDIRKIHVRILDQYGNQVNLNNMDFSFSLELTQLYNNI